MPYSDHPPDIVYPDNKMGREDAISAQSQGIRVGFCNEYKEEKYRTTFSVESKRPCGNRRAEGHRAHNWCFRCMAGFPIWFEDDPDADDLYLHDRAIVST